MSRSDPMKYFQLKPIQAARVSEISETTAAAPVPKNEQVNFHIGNPLMDSRQTSAYLRVALGLDVHNEALGDDDPDALMEALGWEDADRPKLEFLIRTIRKSSPYMPRGGYTRQNPNPLIESFCTWLTDQQESLQYDTGEQSAKREIILASGGIFEALRIILFVLSTYLEITPARILSYRCELPTLFDDIPNLILDQLADDERVVYKQIEEYFAHQPETPTFLLIGDSLEEETRRKLRLLSIDYSLFFIEANNAPNHLSLAREAKLEQRVIRLLTPAIFSPKLASLSTVFIVGNAEFLKVIENVHFNLKGTPSATEVEFLNYLLAYKLDALQPSQQAKIPPDHPTFEGLGFGLSAEHTIPQLTERLGGYLERVLEDHSEILAHSLDRHEKRAALLDKQIQTTWKTSLFDQFASVEANQLIDLLVDNLDNPEWYQAYRQSYLANFTKHQPQYRVEACRIASGSSRTALGIIGFHCGITEVVIPDFSWSYEQCFPTVHTVPLTETLQLDVDAIIEKLEELGQRDPSWHERGAVAVNNPHNATGQIFDQAAIRKLITYCLQNGIYLVDDLSYQNLIPENVYKEIKTTRQHAEELVRQGTLTSTQADRLITVHSISKTDCLAGARLAVVEIREERLRRRFEEVNAYLQPNLAAILISYLFYRGSRQTVQTFWHLRNILLSERSQALLTAVAKLPEDRNPFKLSIKPPMGSLYPLLQIERLPDGISLDWLSSTLARQGIGLLPLSTFARTEKGYDTARKTFRLTLGGADDAETLLGKTRRLLIDFNRLITEEESRYNRKEVHRKTQTSRNNREAALSQAWEQVSRQILQQCQHSTAYKELLAIPHLDGTYLQRELIQHYLPERLEIFRTRLLERTLIREEQMQQALTRNGDWLPKRLEREFMKDSLQRRQELFRFRMYDRTVHPTQAYSLHAEMALNALVSATSTGQPFSTLLYKNAADELLKEFMGQNISITSLDEANEIKLDLTTLTAAEDYAELFTDARLHSLLSFWSDWDGSNRPSGQGHQLIAALVMENVRQMSQIISLLQKADPTIPLDAELLTQINQLPEQNQRFTQLLTNITGLTHQLEQRYKGILPFSVNATPIQQWLTRWNLRRDPVRVLLQHNDRYERRMLELRQQRREMLEHYFALNKRLRKQLYQLIPDIHANRSSKELLQEVVSYHDLLQRTVITPRIHQGLITARDQFGIDTTAYNLDEINTVSGKYGNPGMILALQVSMSSKPDALISLDRKMQTQRERVQREYPAVELPSVWLIPLFEDLESVTSIRTYLDRVWNYAAQSRYNAQSTQTRFAEIISEVFIAGSDLSQQVSQATSALLYRKAKYDVQTWLAEHGVAEEVRLKLGSGESMQRQGGYYSSVAGQPAVRASDDSKRRFARHLPAAARKSTAYAKTPLQGVLLGGDLRTYQSNISEHLRYLPVPELVNLLYHVQQTQRNHRDDLIRAAETITESRLSTQSRSLKELERLTIGNSGELYEDFLEERTDNFRHILYGREEDVVGIHIISYFIGRSLPQLRDRPTSRRKSGLGREQSQQILTHIAEIIPLAKQGSLLRAISHNQSQTAVLGINQLTTGLFRALERFSQKSFAEAEKVRMISEHLLPHLPVYEILHTLRIYQDWNNETLHRIETAFPAGNSAFVALSEDRDAMMRYLPLFQKELLRRHGLNVGDFFINETFIPDLLPTLRPDLAVLLQENLFNTDLDSLLANVDGKVSESWQREVNELLQVPEEIRHWRATIWDVMGESIYQRVQSFAELAAALYSIPAARTFGAPSVITRSTKLTPALSNFFRTARADDEMRQFLLGTLEFLNSFANENVEVPISIIRAMNDVERIAKIEETALPKADQDVIRFCLLQIAHLAGDNG